jgi:hypothetical protein
MPAISNRTRIRAAWLAVSPRWWHECSIRQSFVAAPNGRPALPSSLTYPIRDPRHTPAELAPLLSLMGFELPPELLEHPEPPEELLYCSDIDPDDPNIQY